MALELDDLYQLHEAAAKGMIGHFQYYMTEDPEDPNPRDNLGLTPLHYAALNGRKEMCKFILDLPNVRDKNPGCSKFGATPLHLAAYQGYSEVCKIFLPYLNEKNPGDQRGSTPLHYAAGKGKLETCKVLIENLTNINPQTVRRATPFDFALKRGHFNVARLFGNRFVSVKITIIGQNPNPEPRLLRIEVPSRELEEGPNLTHSPLLHLVLTQAIPSVSNMSDDAAVQYLQLKINDAFI